jgi:hypothetical protein
VQIIALACSNPKDHGQVDGRQLKFPTGDN